MKGIFEILQFQPKKCDAVWNDRADNVRQFNGSGANIRIARIFPMSVGCFVCANVHSRTNDMYVIAEDAIFRCFFFLKLPSISVGDITDGRPKVIVTTLFETFWSIGVFLLPGIASFFDSWSHLYMAISYPTLILVLLWR